jgi:hypothetical protein
MLTYGTSFNGYRLVYGLCWCWIIEPEPSPLEMIFNEIDAALNARLYYAAIAVSLSIPDICAALECDQTDRKAFKRGNRKRYIAWFKANLGNQFFQFTAEDCYSLRCGVLHQGAFGDPDARYDRPVFKLPNQGTVHEFISDHGGETALVMETVIFCHQLIEGARRWLTKKADDPNVAANLPNVVRLRPRGLAPHIVGLPVIA